MLVLVRLPVFVHGGQSRSSWMGANILTRRNFTIKIPKRKYAMDHCARPRTRNKKGVGASGDIVCNNGPLAAQSRVFFNSEAASVCLPAQMSTKAYLLLT